MPKEFPAGKFIWLNGELTETDPRRAIVLPALSQALDYARTGISGIRITPHFQDPGTLLIFSLYEHLVRLEDTGKRLGLQTDFLMGKILNGVLDVVRANAEILMNGGYLRVLVYDDRQMIAPQPAGPAKVAIYAGPFGEYVPEGEFRVTFDDFLRVGDRGRAKSAANYVGFSDSKERAAGLEMHDAIGVTVDRLGKLIMGEGTTSTLLVCLRGRIYAPPLDAGVLAGITRMRVLQLARDLGYQVYEMDLPLSWVPLAEEMFLTGTASYVVPITHFGRHPLETAVGEKLNRRLREVMRGEHEKYSSWNLAVKIS